MKHKIAAEIFGRPIEHYKDKNLFNKIAEGGYLNPFNNKLNGKKTRLMDIPMGVDSVYCNNVPVIIDPSRFLQDDIIFRDIANKFWGTTENVIKIPEVRLANVGNFDFVLVKHKPFSYEIEDFVIIEIQSDSTTGTGALVQNLRDLKEKGFDGLEASYSFGMNTYNTIKLSFMQMLIKGMVVEKWGKHCAWVMQDYVFSNMLSRFDIKNNDFSKNKNSHYFIYEMDRKNEADIFHLKLKEVNSFTVLELKRAFDSERELPDVDFFMDLLKKRLLKEFAKGDKKPGDGLKIHEIN